MYWYQVVHIQVYNLVTVHRDQVVAHARSVELAYYYQVEANQMSTVKRKIALHYMWRVNIVFIPL